MYCTAVCLKALASEPMALTLALALGLASKVQALALVLRVEALTLRV